MAVMREMGTRRLLVYLATVGAVAGFVSWSLIWLGHLVFEVPEPTGLALVLAIPRGALFGVILGLILRAYWGWSTPRT